MPTALKGSKTPLNNLTYIVDVELPAHLRHLVDIAAVLLGSDGRVRSDDDLIFFNNPSCASVALQPDGTLHIDLSRVPADVQRVLVTGSTEAQGKTFMARPTTLPAADHLRRRVRRCESSYDNVSPASFVPPRSDLTFQGAGRRGGHRAVSIHAEHL